MPQRPVLPLVITIVWGVFFLPGLLGALLSPMMFDAPGSMRNPVAIFFVLVILSFPALFSAILAFFAVPHLCVFAASRLCVVAFQLRVPSEREERASP